MQRLFLTSSFIGTENQYRQYIEPILAKKKVTFVDTASKVEEYKKYVDDARNWFKEHGYQITEVDFDCKDREEIVGILNSTELLYISGGNSFFLLQSIEANKLKQVINERISSGMIYVGESAGAIITTPNIEYSAAMDDKHQAKKLKSTNGLALITDYIVSHYGEPPFAESAQKVVNQNTSLPLLKIDNHTAVLYQNQEATILN
ncbi:Type 1 glutamine amidotransferase-like domain-containing protein [Ignavigranum ruoffiae]|uniref:Type 1 glutamine amidotransferase-like domain-containing protein n=1 Tax=Ignavigranum ruoffiae TaxID=89093 RepID=UPI00204F6348|nr:Type 1 glutamine amidotransferase-like domain-containing protein [Ignavigranum ruoffiae]UPQ85112.1 Type 1 glutamine amidotransferase-like domain-containing protein [Ignavigranum ruoffiae]